MNFRNITDETLIIPGFGIVEAGAIIELPTDTNSPNLQALVAEDEKPF